jgi:8-oxo-dGTP pyrophosphatase MutT (NUDIX family)
MPEDIAVTVGGHFFNYRVAAIIRLEDKWLISRLHKEDFWFLPGGRVQDGESTLDAMRREVVEELATECAALRPVFLAESFFSLHNRRFHEVCLYYEVELSGDKPYAIEGCTPVDGGMDLKWAAKHELAAMNLKPAFLAPRLAKLPPTLEHLIIAE